MRARHLRPKAAAAQRRQPPAPAWRFYAYQLLALLLLALAIAYLAGNTQANLQAKGIASGFDFLGQPAGFGIGEGLLPYQPGDAYWRAFLAGLDNTLRIAVCGIVGSTLLGGLLGLGRWSRNFLLRSLCAGYVEIFRNIPLLLQLLACYALLTSQLPELGEAWHFAGCYLSKGGLAFPWPVATAGGWLLDYPQLYPFSIAGGARLTPEFLALWLGLTLYNSAYLAETIRAGLQALPAGQREAAAALGLSHGQTLRRVLLPQALRIIMPPAGNQYSSLIKSSSLAITVGYPDLVSVANTVLNQNGRVVECLSLILLTFLLLSLLMSALINWLNRRVQRWAV